MARKPVLKSATEPAVKAVAETAKPHVALGVAARYRAMTDVQVNEVMHGTPAQMVADLRLLCDGLVEKQKT